MKRERKKAKVVKCMKTFFMCSNASPCVPKNGIFENEPI